ncbi:predicted protein [Plenodomus lingam JN3]|uniref:Predicted protein n=1 Tax=Leptosphaeria maculans (strain JN3 / isolate v23.1.3 / race Av1-4-5-6-7-8) TaxID=985895 RepID=E4ZLU9_LEPMJ|nr:predicted protein [Plenodomus lingam JN3]CBX92779.1 predicted protein [Plenodomus lingam JN3]
MTCLHGPVCSEHPVLVLLVLLVLLSGSGGCLWVGFAASLSMYHVHGRFAVCQLLAHLLTGTVRCSRRTKPGPPQPTRHGASVVFEKA